VARDGRSAAGPSTGRPEDVQRRERDEDRDQARRQDPLHAS
jgi:hypothetical protein